MPLGSPGMGGEKEAPFEILQIQKSGGVNGVYATEQSLPDLATAAPIGPARGKLRKGVGAAHLCYLTGMNDAGILEVLVRGAAAGVFLELTIVVGRGGYSPARVTGVLFCLAAAAHTLTQLPILERALGWTWPPVWALSVMGAGLFWAFATELFADRQSLDARRESRPQRGCSLWVLPVRQRHRARRGFFGSRTISSAPR